MSISKDKIGLDTTGNSSKTFNINCQKTINTDMLTSFEITFIVSCSDSDIDKFDSKLPMLFFCWIVQKIL